jgi:pimeloyl-ACP methyl ester carboxylesterase
VLEIGLALNANVLLVEYPGYWLHFSRGITTANQVKSEAKIALNFVLDELRIPHSQLIVLGMSMGTGVAINLVS